MSKPLKTPLGRGVLALIATTALIALGLRSGTVKADPDDPRAGRNERIAGLAAEVSLLELECAAVRDVLTDSLKKLAALRLCDNREAVDQIKDQFEAVKSEAAMAASLRGEDAKAALDQIRTSFAKREGADEREVPKEVLDLFPKLLEEGEESQSAAYALAKLEMKMQVDLATAEADRMRADYLEKCRSLHLKKLELAEAEGRSGD